MTNDDVYRVSEEVEFQPFIKDRKRQYELLMNALSDYFDYPDPDARIYDDLRKALQDLNRYHQQKATSTKALLARLSLMS